MLRHDIPTAKAKTFSGDQTKEAQYYIESFTPPIVLKADGLAAGKGVVIASSIAEAKTTAQEMLEEKKFGDASAKVLVEEFLDGIELSVFILTDGKDYLVLPEAKDYKRIGDHDTGPNTGGMGSVSPVPFADRAFMKKVEEKIIQPTVNGLKKENIHYQGFIFIGLMKVKDEPYVIEYNARMGDPETQSVMVRIKSDFVELLIACAKGELKNKSIEIDPSFAVTVVMAAGGYPDNYEKGKVISGLENARAKVFHAGTKSMDSKVITDGGRVLAVTGKGKNLNEAIQDSYSSVQKISWESSYYRKDIGQDLLKF
jgi:phosphoribosylamine--glycine ligase